MTNSGIKKVAIITQNNSRSLHDHLSSPKWWDLGSKQGGMFVLSPYLAGGNSGWFKGTADSIYQNLSFLKRSNEPYVVISSGDCVYRMDFGDMLEYHEAKDADITIAYRHITGGEDIRNYGVLELDKDERLLNMEEKPLDPQSDLANTGVYIIKRKLLIELLETISSEGRHNLVRDIFTRYRKRLKIFGYKFAGYWRNMGSVATYYACNMDFLKRDIRGLLAIDPPYIKTKPKDEPPAKFNGQAMITNCLVGSGAILDGNAHGSVIFRKVVTGVNSEVRHSIVMEGTRIGEGCVVEYAILDKDVVLSPGIKIVGTKEEPAIISKGAIK
jgi:glucose-1-phosphate adenylyltransferase